MTIERDEALPEHMPDWLIQWPMMAFAGWWEAVFDAWLPKPSSHHDVECQDLSVPEPIERDGEHALFA